MLVLWAIIVGTLFLFNFISIQKEFSLLARLEAIASFNKDTVYRRWATMHGGVYVPVSEDTPPNPYLSVQERDIATPSGKKLTLMNPAYMTRQSHELGKKQYGLQGHITSLNPLNPENAPDPWETEALKAFEQGKNEVTSIEMIKGKPYYRLIRPFITEEGCLKCHSHQGYKVGDIRGGISLAVPMGPYLASAQRRIVQIAIGLSILWLLGTCALLAGMSNIRNRIKEREDAEHERDRYIEDLKKALKEVKQLGGLLPICSHCKKIRDDKGYWNQIEAYISDHTDTKFSHSICQECAKAYYPDMDLYGD
jgi:two-component system cell cycle sensor histidine kinase/response regulator CckA